MVEYSEEQLAETERIFEIARVMWKAIKKHDKNAADIVPRLRFIGLVLWHLAVRQSPLIDQQHNGAPLLVFTAKMRPNIDPHDPTEWQTMLWHFDQNLANAAMAAEGQKEANEGEIEDGKGEGEEEQNEGEEVELLRELGEKVGQGRAQFGDRERHAELGKKFRLLKKSTSNDGAHGMLNFCFVYRPFLVFGSQSVEILLFIRGLLEGHFNAKTMDEYLENGKQIETNSYLLTTHLSLRMMTIQLLTVGEHFGYKF
ncbi:hypothetical protein niasHT_022463 [Heterodera trifolii]|uniref:Uncharacterized protein n=1 Tax=Heterodera trifolii TaxID=157864 RepID=A0ABD2JGV0_9BILA